MTPSTWIERARSLHEVNDWNGFAQFVIKTNQSFAARNDSQGLESWYRSIIQQVLDSKEKAALNLNELDIFRISLKDAFAAAKKKLADGVKGQTKAIYFEYFFDGGDSCLGNLFLCTTYDSTDDEWAALYSDYVEGPSVFEYLNYDPDIEWDDFKSVMAGHAVDGFFLSVCIEEWEKSGIKGLPLGFAMHDAPVIHIPANVGANMGTLLVI